MKHLIYLIAVMAILAVSQTAQGAVLDSCDQWASYCSGSYCVYNAQWGMVSGSNQCITASSATSWYVVATQPSNGIKSYPNSGYLPSTTIGTSITSSVSTSSPSSGNWNLAYDVWAPQEVMIWLRWMGAVGPWGSYVTTATIDGRGWDVYKNGYPGYLAQSQLSGGTFNISAFLADSVSRGWLSNGATVTPVQCGWEITGCSNQTFTMNSFSVTVGGASTSTTAASTTTTAATTTTTSGTTTSATTTTTSGGSCDCGTCSWYGSNIPTCCQSCSGWGWQDGGCNRSCVCPGSCPGGTTTTAATTTTTAATTTTTAATTSTTTTASSTSTTSATTTTTSGGSCSCGTCSWYGSQIPTCCQSCSGWGWQDGGCNRSCVCSGSCPNN